MVTFTFNLINQYIEFCRCYGSTREPLLALASSQGCVVFLKLEQRSVGQDCNSDRFCTLIIFCFASHQRAS